MNFLKNQKFKKNYILGAHARLSIKVFFLISIQNARILQIWASSFFPAWWPFKNTTKEKPLLFIKYFDWLIVWQWSFWQIKKNDGWLNDWMISHKHTHLWMMGGRGIHIIDQPQHTHTHIHHWHFNGGFSWKKKFFFFFQKKIGATHCCSGIVLHYCSFFVYW